jgi:hypothetical protein
VEFRGGSGERFLVLNALRLQMALFGAMECCLEELPEGSRVRVGIHDEDGALVTEFRGVGEGSQVESRAEWRGWQRLEELLETLGARLERCPSGYGIRFLFSREPGGKHPSSAPEDMKRA